MKSLFPSLSLNIGSTKSPNEKQTLYWYQMQHNSVASVCLCRLFFSSFLFKASVNTSPPKLVQTARESDWAELHATSLESLFPLQCRFLYLFIWTSGNKSSSSIISFPTDPMDCHSRALIYIFNPLMSHASIHAERGKKRTHLERVCDLFRCWKIQLA